MEIGDMSLQGLCKCPPSVPQGKSLSIGRSPRVRFALGDSWAKVGRVPQGSWSWQGTNDELLMRASVHVEAHVSPRAAGYPPWHRCCTLRQPSDKIASPYIVPQGAMGVVGACKCTCRSPCVPQGCRVSSLASLLYIETAK